MRRLWGLRAKLSWPGPDAPVLSVLDAEPGVPGGELPPASGWIRFLPAWPSCRCSAKGDAAASFWRRQSSTARTALVPKVKRGAIMKNSVASPIF
jgi:hypothetical protein